MDSISLLCPSLDLNKDKNKKKKDNNNNNNNNGVVLFDSSLLQSHPKIPKQFIWPQHQREPATIKELKTPIIDLQGFFNKDQASTQEAIELIRDACSKHGFFQVINHGINASLSHSAFESLDWFFKKQPLDRKLRAQRRPGSMWGYAGAHTDRFLSRLPWKETLSFGCDDEGGGSWNKSGIVEYLVGVLGKEFEQMGLVYQRYCEAMFGLSLAIMELLARSLGVDQQWYRDFFEDGSCIMRCNYYPPCQEPDLALGTGPHCDPTALTILQQDRVKGLEVFTQGEWQSVSPVHGALVINIGDTFMTLSNGRYKSCLHRAVVNPHTERRSLAFFLCPKGDKIVKPPPSLMPLDLTDRKYPDFKWSELLRFTQEHYRADTRTLQCFSNWIKTKQV